MVDRFLLARDTPVITAGADGQMKIYMLLMLISVIVGFSYIPSRNRSKQAETAAPESLPANA
jgi:hypothetical protein